MSDFPKPLGSLSPVQRLLMLSKAARMGAQESRKTVARLATLPDATRVTMSAISEREEEVARQLEEQGNSFEAEAAELVRQMPPSEARPYLEHRHPDLRVAAFAAVCATHPVRR